MTHNAPKDSRSRRRGIPGSRMIFFSLAAFALLAIGTTSAFMAPNTGHIYTTDVACSGVDLNIYSSKDVVFLNGGPTGGGSGLPDGNYYVQVTEPDGTPLGHTTTASVVVSGGVFQVCYQLSVILVKQSDGTAGYDTTTNSGGEYKVWASKNPEFPESESKTDSFKVKEEEVIQQGTLNVIKFYDANANGLNDDGQLITGWKVRIQDGIDLVRFTPATLTVDADDYVVTEFAPAETNWVGTTTNPVNISIANGDNKTVEFGNLCLGPGGGKTLGFWSNKNGQAQMNDGGTLTPELDLLESLCLAGPTGTLPDNYFNSNYGNFRTWILNATATNMAYMLSAQLAAMKLNIEAGFVNPDSLIYAPGTPGANSLGFATVGLVVSAAQDELCLHGTAYSVDSWRAYQEALKNALDDANNNKTFVQSTPCPFTF